ncbi:unnamed protein product [Closterium sp. NIES-54]
MRAWLTRDAAARLAIRNHLPLAERAHFGQQKTAKALYDAVVARYSSPATAALGRLTLPYLFLELSAFATVEDLVTNLCTSNAHYRAALPAEFLDTNPPPMYITLYFIVARLPHSLRAVRDNFLALDPSDLTVDLLEQHLLAAESSVVPVGATRGTPCTPFFEGCSPSPLAPSYACAAAVNILGAEDVGAACATSGKDRSGKGKGGKSGGDGSGGGGGGGSGGGGGGGGGGSGGSGGGSGGFGGSGGGGGTGGSGSGGSRGGAVLRRGCGGGQRQQQQCRSETPSPQQLREWFAQRGASKGSVRCTYVICMGDPDRQTCGKPHSQQHCFSRLDNAWRAEFGDEAELPRWAELVRPGIDIFALEYDAILAAMNAFFVSAEGDCYRCVPLDPSIEATALGASDSAILAEKRNEPPPSKIEALDGSNYEEWSGRMRSAFKRYKLLKLAMGEEKMLEEGDARDRWIEKSAVLDDLILQSVNNDMFQHIKDLVELDDSGPKAWKLLRDMIQPITLPMVIMLEKELAALSMRPGDDVKPVLDKIKDTYARMAAAGSNVSQMQQCTKIISVLNNSWDNLIPTLNTQQDQWTPEWLRQQILQEDFRRRHMGGGAANKTAEGYGAAGGSRGRGGGRGRGRGRGFGRGRGRGDYNEGHGSSARGGVCYVMLSFAFTPVCLPSYVRVLHAWCERV